MSLIASDTVVADSVGMVLVGLMWALSLVALAGAAHLIGKWLRNREERQKRPLERETGPVLDRKTLRGVRRGQRRADNASDLDGYL